MLEPVLVALSVEHRLQVQETQGSIYTRRIKVVKNGTGLAPLLDWLTRSQDIVPWYGKVQGVHGILYTVKSTVRSKSGRTVFFFSSH